MRSLSSVMIKSRDWFPKFANGLNIKIDIAQKVALLFLRTPLKPHPSKKHPLKTHFSKRAPSKKAPSKSAPSKNAPHKKQHHLIMIIMIFKEVKK